MDDTDYKFNIAKYPYVESASTRVGIGVIYFSSVMPKKKKEYVKKRFESDCSSSDTSANIYMSMLMSEKWQKLTKNAQVLYVYCKAQYYAEKKKPNPAYKQLAEGERNRCFTMNKSKWEKLYHIYTNGNQFYKDMRLLVENGFIEVIECGRLTRTKNIYMLSDKWQS